MSMKLIVIAGSTKLVRGHKRHANSGSIISTPDTTVTTLPIPDTVPPRKPQVSSPHQL
jgi:hypothetical protein